MKREKYFLIVEPGVSGIHQLNALKRRGIKPLILFNKSKDQYFKKHHDKIFKNLGKFAEFIYEKENFNDTLKELKKYNLIAITPGCEYGVELASKIATALNYLGNPYNRINDFNSKEYMHEALKKAGMRYIRGTTASSLSDAIKAYKKLKCKQVIIKPVDDAGACGFYICANLDEFKKNISKFFKGTTLGVKRKKVLIQERIMCNEEYIVNTMSIKGKTRVISILKYGVSFNDVGVVFSAIHIIKKIDNKIKRLIKYAIDTAKAVGIKNGPVHGEYFYDEQGPVLIEVNCRVMGALNSYPFLNCVLGGSDHEEVIDDLIFPDTFTKKSITPHLPYQNGAARIIYVPNDTYPVSHPILALINHLECRVDVKDWRPTGKFYPRSVNVDGCIFEFFLIHKDEEIFNKEDNLLKTMNDKYFHLLVENKGCNDLLPPLKGGVNTKALIKEIIPYKSLLLLTDLTVNYKYVMKTDLNKLDTTLDEYKCGVIDYDLRKFKGNREQLFKQLVNYLNLIRVNGELIVTYRTVSSFPYGLEGINIVLKLLGFNKNKVKGYLSFTKSR